MVICLNYCAGNLMTSIAVQHHTYREIFKSLVILLVIFGLRRFTRAYRSILFMYTCFR